MLGRRKRKNKRKTGKFSQSYYVFIKTCVLTFIISDIDEYRGVLNLSSSEMKGMFGIFDIEKVESVACVKKRYDFDVK